MMSGLGSHPRPRPSDDPLGTPGAANPLLPTVRLDQIPSQQQPQPWLIEQLWSEAGVGILGGHPKLGKTWCGLEMALAVASGKPCFGRFECRSPGPVLLYLAEDSLPRVRDRIAGICGHRRIAEEGLDLFLITAPSLRLDQPRDRDRLAATVAAFEPRLLLLDPLVRLHRLDENNASEISGLLGDLRRLQRENGTAIVLVHHARKSLGGRPGQGLRGSSDLWAWGDSNAYLARGHGTLTLTLEHRHLPAPEPIALELRYDTAARLEVVDKEISPRPGTAGPPLGERVIAALRDAGQLTRAALRARLGVQNQRLGDALASLEEAGQAQRRPGGWRLAPPRDRSVPAPCVEKGTERTAATPELVP